MKIIIGLVFFVTLLCACQRQNRDEELLKEAAILHNDMMAMLEQLEDRLNILEADTTARIPIDSIKVWRMVIEAWEKDIVEVPGNEAHEQHKTGDHHHHDHKVVEVTPDQMLTIQQELKNRLETIQARVEHMKAMN